MSVQGPGVQRPHCALIVDDGVGDDVVMVMMRIQRPARAVDERRRQQTLGVDDLAAAAGDRGDLVEMSDRGAVGDIERRQRSAPGADPTTTAPQPRSTSRR